jgi:hypothetical protein
MKGNAGGKYSNQLVLEVFSLPVTLRPNTGHGFLVLEVSRSHNDASQLVGLLWTSDQFVAETSTWQHTTTLNRQSSMPPAGFELTIPAIERPKTYALVRPATGTGVVKAYVFIEICINNYFCNCQ